MENKPKTEKYLIEDDFNASLNAASKIFQDGGLFIYPTDTIYGFGCDAFNRNAVEKLLEIKGRDASSKFILLTDSVESLAKWIKVSSEAQVHFLENIWPAAVSVVLELNARAAKWLNQPTAAFRIPKHKFCNSLLGRIKNPLVSTSVNKSGSSPLNDEKLIELEFGDKVEAIFYSNQKSGGAASTLIDLTTGTPKLLREGSFKYDKILSLFYS
jgi:L-threonylcarbamoyladenylate synthase